MKKLERYRISMFFRYFSGKSQKLYVIFTYGIRW